MVVGSIPATYKEAQVACAGDGTGKIGRLYEPRDVGSYLELMEDIAEDLSEEKSDNEDQGREFWIGITDKAEEDKYESSF